MQVTQLPQPGKTIPVHLRLRHGIAAHCVFLSGLLLALSCLQASIQAQQPIGTPAAGPERHEGPPHGLPLPHPEIHPPKGKIPEPGTSVVFDAAGMGSPMILDHNWRLGIAHGTDPANPEFDDSNWPVRDAKDALADVVTRLDVARERDDAGPDHQLESGPSGRHSEVRVTTDRAQ